MITTLQAGWRRNKSRFYLFDCLSPLRNAKWHFGGVRSIQFPHTQSHSRAHMSAVLGLQYQQHPSRLVERTSLPSELKLSRMRLFGSNTPINTSCCCNKPVVLPIFSSNYTAITISCFDLLPLLQSFICLKLSEWMSRDIYLRERKAWSPELCPICPVIWWRDAHWATAVDTSWSEAWRITWHCWYCALWVHLAVNSNISKHLRKIRTKANRTPSRSLNWFGFGRFKINSLFT